VNLTNLEIIVAEIDWYWCAGSFSYFDLSESDLKFPVCCHTDCNPCSRLICRDEFAKISASETEKKIYKPLSFVYRELTDWEVME
jgi:hypothetical protein